MICWGWLTKLKRPRGRNRRAIPGWALSFPALQADHVFTPALPRGRDRVRPRRRRAASAGRPSARSGARNSPGGPLG